MDRALGLLVLPCTLVLATSPDLSMQALSPAEALAETGSTVSDDNFVHGFFAALSVIIVSELGDKTFFIAAIMSMKHPRLTVFAGAILSLAMMHIGASFFGSLTTLFPRLYTYYISSLLFAVFGLKMLHEGYHMSPTEGQEELEEVGEELRKKEEQEKKGGLETGGGRGAEPSAISFLSKIFIQSFTMTTLAEWGDRSQLATVILGEVNGLGSTQNRLKQIQSQTSYKCLICAAPSGSGGRVRRVRGRRAGPRALHGARRGRRQDHRHQDIREDRHPGEGGGGVVNI